MLAIKLILCVQDYYIIARPKQCRKIMPSAFFPQDYFSFFSKPLWKEEFELSIPSSQMRKRRPKDVERFTRNDPEN